MNRRSWWQWLAGLTAASAQVIPDEPVCAGYYVQSGPGEKWKCVPRSVIDFSGLQAVLVQNGKPRNGQCPVCWAIAKPYGQRPTYPTEQLIRCAHCSAAFWQDAEKER